MKQNNKKAVIYCRVASGNQNDKPERSITEQESMCREFAERNGLTVIKVISDVASGKNAKRFGFAKLQNLVRGKKVDVVCVQHVDRLSRDVEDFSSFLALLKKHRVELATYSNPVQKLVEAIMASMAQYESEVHRERILRALARKKDCFVRERLLQYK